MPASSPKAISSCPECGARASGFFCYQCGQALDRHSSLNRDSEKSPNAVHEISYPDVAASLTSHTWLVLLYAVGCALAVYVVQWWATPEVLFWALQLPTLAMTTAVVRTNKVLRWRVPGTWLVTAFLAWGYSRYRPFPEQDGGWPAEIVSVTVIVILVHWLARAVDASITEFRENHRLNERGSLAPAVADLFSVWGATLMIAAVGSSIVRAFLEPPL